MKNILLCPNMHRDTGLRVTLAAKKMIEAAGDRAVLCPLFEENAGYSVPPELEPCAVRDQIARADMIFCLGGDGTILHVAKIASEFSVPILGINMGNRGFMAELEGNDISLIPQILAGHYHLDKRMMIDVSIEREGKTVFSDFALNDAVVKNGGDARIVYLTLYGDGRKLSSFMGDGLILSTPTGSTAYSMSAGGPIVEASAENIIMTPICAHALQAKAFVLAYDRQATVKIGRLAGGKAAHLSVDGGASVELQSGDVVRAKKSAHITRLIRVLNRSFYDILNTKLAIKNM